MDFRKDFGQSGGIAFVHAKAESVPGSARLKPRQGSNDQMYVVNTRSCYKWRSLWRDYQYVYDACPADCGFCVPGEGEPFYPEFIAVLLLIFCHSSPSEIPIIY
jgi:hypothetical protein